MPSDATLKPQALLTTGDVAQILQVAPRTVRRWTRAGFLDPVYLGPRTTRYTPESIESLLHTSTNSKARATNASLAESEFDDDAVDHRQSP
jgi:DNA-binding transcriptional MerR regulator